MEATVASETYLILLSNKVVPTMLNFNPNEDDSAVLSKNTSLQQDGRTPDYS